jgi:hypothetical protein
MVLLWLEDRGLASASISSSVHADTEPHRGCYLRCTLAQRVSYPWQALPSRCRPVSVLLVLHWVVSVMEPSCRRGVAPRGSAAWQQCVVFCLRMLAGFPELVGGEQGAVLRCVSFTDVNH